MPIFRNRDKSGNLSCNFAHTAGVPWMPASAAVAVTLDDANEQIAIKMRAFKGEPAYISYSQIVSVGTISEKEVMEKSKSVIGRAALGGLVLGPLGAIIGGMSGTGTKQKTSNKYFFIINYTPMEHPDEIKIISLEIVGATLHLGKFSDALRSKIKAEPQMPISNHL